MSILQQRLKYDFKFYIETRLKIPYSENKKYTITNMHFNAITTIMDSKFTLIEAYRGFGKSELISFAWLLWRAEFWNEDGIIFSANENLAFQKLDLIRTACEFDNPELNYMCCKGIEGYIWNRGEIWLIDKNNPIVIESINPRTDTLIKHVNYKIKAKLHARSIQGISRGMHVHNIVGDDIVVEENSKTFELRETTSRQFFASTIPIRLPDSKMVVVGTPQNDQDLLSQLRDNYKWVKYIVPVYNIYNQPNCPELHTNDWIKEQRDLMGENAFNQEMMLQPIDQKSSVFSWDVLFKSKNNNTNMQVQYKRSINEIVLIGTDFAVVDDRRKAEKGDSDFFALAALKFNVQSRKRSIINLYQDRGIGFLDQIRICKLWIEKYDANAICLELHSFLDIYRQLLESEVKGFPIEDTGSKAGKFDLYDGIPSMLYSWERNLWEIPYGDSYSQTYSNLLFNQLNQLGKAKHDDLADALFRAEKICQRYSGTEAYDKNFSMHNKTISSKLQEQLKLTSVFTDADYGEKYKTNNNRNQNSNVFVRV